MKPTRVVILLLVLLVPFAGYSQRRSRAQKTVSKTPTSTASLPLVFTLAGDLPRFSPDGRYIGARNDGNSPVQHTTRIWDAVTGQLLISLDDRRFLGFSDDSRFMMLDGQDGSVSIHELREIPSNRIIRSWRAYGYFPNSKLFVTWRWDESQRKHLAIWETETGNLLGSLDDQFGNFYAAGQYLAFETDDNTGRTLLWDVAAKRSLRFIEGKFAAFSHDGGLIATKTKSLVKVYDSGTGQLLSSVDCWGDYPSFSPDGQVIATEVYDSKLSAKDSVIKLWEARTGRVLATLPGGDGGVPTFSPDGKIIATQPTNCLSTKLWTVPTGVLRNTVDGCFNGFSPDGKLLTTSINNLKTKVYETDNAQLIARLDGYPIGFSPDGRLILTGTNFLKASEEIKVWRLGASPSPEKEVVGLKPSSSEATAIGPKAIWNPPNVVWERMRDECNQQNGEPAFVDCVASFMQRTGASTEAIEFTKLMNGEGFMASFREMGKVDFATVYLPFRSTYRDSTMVLINGTPQIIGLNELDQNEYDRLVKIDIPNDPLYPTLARKFPKIAFMGFSEGVETMQRLPTGGQRFIIKYPLLNGCYGCVVGGDAHVAFDFDGTGTSKGIKLMRLSGVAPVRQPRKAR